MIAPPVVTVIVPVPLVFAMMASKPETVLPVATSTLPPPEPAKMPMPLRTLLPEIAPALVILTVAAPSADA